MAKKRTKVMCLRQDGEVFKLFSVSETSDCSLIISLEKESRSGGFKEGLSGQVYVNHNAPLDEQRFTVHPSIGRDGLSITHNSRYKGTKVTGKLLVDAVKDDLVACFATKFCPIMNERSKPDLRRNDCDFIEIAEIKGSDLSSVIYHLVATSRDIQLNNIKGFLFINYILRISL